MAVVLITGSSSGFGLEGALAFARNGDTVYATMRDVARGGRLRQVADEEGLSLRIRALDVTRPDSFDAFINTVVEESGRIDVLVNNAGLERITPLQDPDDTVEGTFRRITDINTNGTFLVTRHAAPKMQSGGRIILTASIWSRVAVPDFSAYVASKHANLGFMRAMAHELGPRGIRVNAVCPGWVRTEAAMLSLANMFQRTGRSEADLLAEIVGAQVLPGLLEPDDMAPLYLFLASDGARDITGQAMMLDRGEVMA